MKLTQTERDFFGQVDSITVPASAWRSLQANANELYKIAGFMETMLGSCMAALGQTDESNRPETFTFDDYANPSSIGLQLSGLDGLSRSLRSHAIDHRMRLETLTRQHVLADAKLPPSEKADLLNSELSSDSLFDPKTFAAIRTAVGERQREERTQSLLEQAAGSAPKRARVSAGGSAPSTAQAQPSRSQSSYRGQPHRGRSRGRGRGQSSRGSRGASATAKSGAKAAPQSFH